MSGLLLIGIAVIWAIVALLLATYAAGRVKTKGVGITIWILVFAVLLPLPLIDEIVGGFQFRALCREGAVMRYESEALKGSLLTIKKEASSLDRMYDSPPAKDLTGVAIPIRETTFEFYVQGKSAPVLTYKTYSAKGGWLIRALGISQSDSPLTMPSGFCGPTENVRELFERLNVETTNWKWK